MQTRSGIPDEVLHGVGGYPTQKAPVKILEDGSEVGKPTGQPPALPPR